MALAATAVVMIVGPLMYFQYAKRANTPGQQAAAPHPLPAVKRLARTADAAPQRALPILAFALSAGAPSS